MRGTSSRLCPVMFLVLPVLKLGLCYHSVCCVDYTDFKIWSCCNKIKKYFIQTGKKSIT